MTPKAHDKELNSDFISYGQLWNRIAITICIAIGSGCVSGPAALLIEAAFKEVTLPFPPIAFFLAAIIGAIVGVLGAPILAILLWRKNLVIVAVVVTTIALASTTLWTSIWFSLASSIPTFVTMLVAAVILSASMADRIPRVMRGYCPVCGYDLRGLSGRGCPECGHKEGRYLESSAH